MKKILFVILSMVLLLSSIPVQSIHAAENEKTYYLEWYWEDSKHVHITRRLEFTIPDDISVYAIFTKGGPSSIAINFLHDGDNTTYAWEYSDHEFSNVHSNNYSHNDISIKNTQWWINATPQQSVGINFSCGDDYTTNLPLFDSKDSVVNYITNGNTDGWLNKPEYDLSEKHDFNSDLWTPDIPVPELSKISHTGFTLENWTEDYYVDIIVNNHLSRIVMGKRYPSNDVIPLIIDSDPWYSEHYWNFTLHDVIPSRFVIDINEIFGVDIQGALIEDFKNWSIAHPTIKTVDRYNWTHIGQADEYLAKHVYKADSDLSDVQQLINSGQAITEYYVRFYTLDGKYGQWAHYKLRDFTYDNQGELVDVGRVTAGTIDSTGKPSNTIVGSTDSSGNIDYSPIVDTNVDVNVGELRDVLESFANGVGQLPSLIAQVFSFLPWWINAMIAGVIAICIMLRVLGR